MQTGASGIINRAPRTRGSVTSQAARTCAVGEATAAVGGLRCPRLTTSRGPSTRRRVQRLPLSLYRHGHITRATLGDLAATSTISSRRAAMTDVSTPRSHRTNWSLRSSSVSMKYCRSTWHEQSTLGVTGSTSSGQFSLCDVNEA